MFHHSLQLPNFDLQSDCSLLAHPNPQHSRNSGKSLRNRWLLPSSLEVSPALFPEPSSRPLSASRSCFKSRVSVAKNTRCQYQKLSQKCGERRAGEASWLAMEQIAYGLCPTLRCSSAHTTSTRG